MNHETFYVFQNTIIHILLWKQIVMVKREGYPQHLSEEPLPSPHSKLFVGVVPHTTHTPNSPNSVLVSFSVVLF